MQVPPPPPPPFPPPPPQPWGSPQPPVQNDPTDVVWRRVLAFLIDVAIQAVVWIALLLIFGKHHTDPSPTGMRSTLTIGNSAYELRGTASALANLFLTALWFGNVAVLQGITGQSVGKRALGITVVKEGGQTPGVWKAFLRALLWIVDGFPYCIPGLTGFIVAMSTARHQRVGDMAANTYVVRAADAGKPIPLPATAVGPPAGAYPPGGSPPGGYAPQGYPPQGYPPGGYAPQGDPPPPPVAP